MDNGYSLSDVASVLNNNNGGFGGIIMLVILFLFVVMFMRGSNGDNNAASIANAVANATRYQPQYATQSDVQNSMQFGNLLDGNRDLANLIQSGTAQGVAATNQAKYDNINVLKDAQLAIGQQIADVRTMEQSLMENQNGCCSSTKQLILEQAANTNAQIAQNKYEAALNLAGVEARLTAKMDANEITALRDQLNEVRLAQATGNIPRVGSTYPGYIYPFAPFPPFPFPPAPAPIGV